MKSLLVGLVLLSQGTAFAATTETNATKVKPVTKTKLKSSDYRADKKFSVALGFGISLSEPSQNISTEFFIDGDTHITLRGAYGDDERNNNDSDKEEQFTVELGLKQFVTNTFYLNPTIYYRDYTLAKTRYNYDTDTDVARSEGYTDAGIGFAIGNQWQFKRLTLGCDWFGLSSSVKAFDDSTEYGADEYSINLLNFYIGMSF